MSKSKYKIYQVVADFCSVNEEYYNYRDAFAKYQRQEIPKTMYGIDEQGSVSVIFSKG
jgi:hypothetical protein